MTSPRPMAPLGRADLLASLVHLAPAERRAAAAMLGFVPKPLQAREGDEAREKVVGLASPVETGGPGVPSVVARRAPLKVAEMVVAQPLVQAVPESEVTPPSLQALSAEQIAALLDPRADGLPAMHPIWPEVPGTRCLADGLQRPPMCRAVDWSAAARRLAQLKPLVPLPRSQTVAPAAHVVVVLDDSPGMAVYRQDAANLVHAYMRWRGTAGVELWLWPPGAYGTPVPLQGGEAPRPWSAHTAVLLISRLDGEGNALLWPRRLAQLQAEGAPITLLFPGGAAELPAAAGACSRQVAWTEPGTRPPSPDDLLRVMQALSVFTMVDATLVRACRRAFAPQASASLDAQAWRHPALRGQGSRRPWVPAERDALAQALHDSARWATADLLRLAALVLQLRHALPASEQGLELLNVAAALRSRGAALPGPLAEAFAQASHQQGLLASHALLTARAAVAGQTELGQAGAAAAFAARNLLAWPAPSRQAWRELTSQWFAAAAWADLNAGRPVPAIDGVDTQSLARWMAVKLPAKSIRPVAVQQVESGLALAWGDEADDWLARSRTLGRFLVTGGQVKLTTSKGIRLLTLPRSASGCIRLGADLPATGVHLEVRSLLGGDAGLVLTTLGRPRWADSWWRGPNGVMVEVPTPWGEPAIDMLHPRADRGAAMARCVSDAGWELVVNEDNFGPYCDLRREDFAAQRFRYIVPGLYLIGTSDGGFYEYPRYPVEVSDGLWLADTPCTQALWQLVMGANPSHFKFVKDAGERPVESVSWYQVEAFLSQLKSLLPDGVAPVLPAEAEWECACRSGSATAYHWGDTFDPACANVGYGAGAVNETSPVKRYAPNAWGLYDMHGNVWEWCAFGTDYPDRSGGIVSDPMGPVGAVNEHVLRGGSWCNAPASARASTRALRPPTAGNSHLGFRLALRSTGTGPGLLGLWRQSSNSSGSGSA